MELVTPVLERMHCWTQGSLSEGQHRCFWAACSQWSDLHLHTRVLEKELWPAVLSTHRAPQPAAPPLCVLTPHPISVPLTSQPLLKQ